MNSTSVNLLKRLRDPKADFAWQQFVELYAPLIFHWARRKGLSAEDSADLVQDVLTTLVMKLPEFQYTRRGDFAAGCERSPLTAWPTCTGEMHCGRFARTAKCHAT